VSTPGKWEKLATTILLNVIEEYSCAPWRNLQKAMVERGPSPDGSEGSWPYKAWLKAKRKVLSGEAYGFTSEPLPRTHSEAVARMMRAFGEEVAK